MEKKDRKKKETGNNTAGLERSPGKCGAVGGDKGRGNRLHRRKSGRMVHRRMDGERIPGGWKSTGRCTFRGDGLPRNVWDYSKEKFDKAETALSSEPELEETPDLLETSTDSRTVPKEKEIKMKKLSSGTVPDRSGEL